MLELDGVSRSYGVASITLLIPLTGRLYTGAILQTHKQTKLREAWRAARA